MSTHTISMKLIQSVSVLMLLLCDEAIVYGPSVIRAEVYVIVVIQLLGLALLRLAYGITQFKGATPLGQGRENIAKYFVFLLVSQLFVLVFVDYEVALKGGDLMIFISFIFNSLASVLVLMAMLNVIWSKAAQLL